ncbi:MAG: 5'-deoxyadenosine deaminase [Myxococcota bacterium]
MVQPLLIQGAQWVTMDPQARILTGDLLIDAQGRIAALGDALPAPDGVRRFDARGLTGIPGLVQTHIHLCQSLFRNMADDLVLIDWLRQRIWPFEGALSEHSMRTSVEYGLAELIRGGTTTLLDMGTVHHTDVIAETLAASGLRAWFGKAMMDEGDDIPPSLRETRAESLRHSLALAERWHGAADGRLRYAFCPRFAFSCSTSLLHEVGDIIASEGYLLHTHANETQWEVEESQRRFGTTNIDYLHQTQLTGPRSVFAHGVHLGDDEVQRLASTDTCITHCPSSNLKLASGIANIPRLWDAGVRVGLGADGAPCNNNLDGFVEMRLAALLQKPIHGPTAMPAQRVLQLATLDGARVLGWDDEVGSLEVGKSADLVLLDLNKPHHGVSGAAAEQLGANVYARIVYSAHASDVCHVFASGRQLVDDGELVDIDVEALQAKGQEASRAIVERLDG